MDDNNIHVITKVVDDLDRSQLKVEKHAFDVINSSDTSLNLVKEGIREVNEIVEQINVLNEEIVQSSENIKKLEDLSHLIDGFAGAISKIAGKTNMLSLNASIEAARAGENGRGFAVVAKEVGNLAAQTTKSSKDIEDTVKEVDLFVTTMVDSMKKIYDYSLAQHEKAAKIENLFNKILEAATVANNESRNMEHEIAFQRDVTDKVRRIIDEN